MIQENLSYPDNLNYRDPVSYMAARWFDEPFQADILSNALSKKLHITTVDEDRYIHADFYYMNQDGSRTLLDAKLCTRNFKLINSETKTVSYTDAITIGERAYSSSAQLISFVWRSALMTVSHEELRTLQPISTRVSKGFNGHSQTLYHYSVDSLLNLPGTRKYDLRRDVYNIYDDFYSMYERAHNIILDIPFPKTESERVYANSIRLRTLNAFREELIPLIIRYNSLYSVNSNTCDVPVNDFADKLKDILAAI